MLEIYSKDEERMAWAEAWVMEEVEGQPLVAIPLLCLSYDAGMDLCARQSYAKAFEGAQALVEGQRYDLHVVHGEFPLYKTGVSALERVCFALTSPGSKLDVRVLFKIIKRGGELLRG